MRTRPRHLLLAVAAVVSVSAVAACSDSSSGGSDASTSPSGSEPTTGSSGVDDSTVDGSTVTTTTIESGATTTAGAGASTTVAAGSATTVPAPPESDPFATAPEPDPTEPDDMPGPPADDCADAVAGPATVELGFDDDRVVYGGATAPSCVRIHANQQLVLRSTSGAASTVLVGTEVYDIAAGATATTAALGSLYGIGEVFDVYVEHLDITVVVQVLP